MSSPIRLTREEIKKLVHGVRSLDDGQRALVADLLETLAHSSDGHVSTEELKHGLRRLREDHRISDVDADAVMKAVFG